MNENERDHPEDKEDFNVYAPPRKAEPPAEHDWRRRLRRQRTKWMWLAMLPSLFLISVVTGLGPIVFLGSLVWIGYCVSRVCTLSASISGNPGEPQAGTCLLYVGLLLMNFVVGCILLWAGCVAVGIMR